VLYGTYDPILHSDNGSMNFNHQTIDTQIENSGALELDLFYYVTKNGKSPCRIMHCFWASFIALDFPLMWQRTSIYWKKQTSVTSVKHTIKICSLKRWRTFLERLTKRGADLVHGGNASSSCNHAKGPDLIGLVMEAPLHLTHQDFKTHCTCSLKRLSNLNLQCKTPVNTSGKPKVPCHIQKNLNYSFPRPICKSNAFNMGKPHNWCHTTFRWAL
jgi:hypothetical protein